MSNGANDINNKILGKAPTSEALLKSTNSSPGTIQAILDQQRDQIIKALPKHLSPDRMMRIAMTELRKTPKLQESTPASFLSSIVQASQLGLEPGSALGQCYLIPYNNKNAKVMETQLQIGYRGFIDLARRSGKVSNIYARVAYSKDQFEYVLGTKEHITHKPYEKADRGDFRCTYAVIIFTDGSVQFDIMWPWEIEKIRAISKSGESGPWVEHFDEMAKKTAVRRLLKYAPLSPEIMLAVGLDEQSASDIPQDSVIFDADFKPAA